MKKQKRPVWVLTMLTILLFSILYLPHLIGAGDMEPPGPPAPTMKTLDETPPTWSQILDSTDGNPDGCNSSRFACVMGGAAVLDKETGLVWERSPESTTYNWFGAGFSCLYNAVGSRKGWRLPTVEDLLSLVDTTQSNPALPSGHPFLNVMLDNVYWTKTTAPSDPSTAAWVEMVNGGTLGLPKETGSAYKWCVRGGHGYDGYY